MKAQAFDRDWIFYKKNNPEEREKICLPHDAMILEPRIPKLVAGETSGYFPGGEYIYEKEFFLGSNADCRTILLDFDGVYQKSKVYLNDEEVGGTVNGYSNFYVNLTDRVKYDANNTIRVEVDNSQTPNSRWYTGSGIYREVRLLSASEDYIVPDGIKVHATSIAPALIEVSLDTCLSADGKDFDLHIELTKKGSSSTVPVSVMAKAKTEKSHHCNFIYLLQIDDPVFWSADTPNLYEMKLTLLKLGKAADTAEVTFGLNCLRWSAGEGLVSNGEEIKLRGACIHHDNGILGACEFKEAVYRKLRLLKEVGYNSIRTAHNPPSRILLEACDELGMYMMAEFSDVWAKKKNPYDYSLYFESNWEKDLTAMVKKLYNHPCVVMYATGNEVADVKNVDGLKNSENLANKLHELDPTRPVTNCVNVLSASLRPSTRPLRKGKESPDDIVDPKRTGKASPLVGSKFMNIVATFLPNLISKVKPEQVEANLKEAMRPLDLIGLNYGTHLTESLNKLNPSRLIVHSETYPSAIGKTWPVTSKYKHVVGDFMWTGWDYLGEAGLGVVQYGSEPQKMNKPYPCISGGVGSINLIGGIVAQGHFSKIVFGQSAEPYIGVRPLQYAGKKRKVSKWRGTDVVNSWSWAGFEGTEAELEVFSAGHEVELKQDGKSLGRKIVGEYKALFTANYQPGVVEAIAYNEEGAVVGRSRLESAAGETQIQAHPEKPKLLADGKDIVFINVSLTDANGVVKVLEEKEIFVKVEGCGVLQAVGSGTPYPTESYRGDSFTTYFGEMAAVIRSTTQSGMIKVTISADGLPEKQVEILSEKIG